ncbi:hypothetical protein, partial [Salmonella enterica]|uniref:hypothetical protein n=1 Tax=Salmonella enterica TaxID=28901 RepID=UPI0020C4E44B
MIARHRGPIRPNPNSHGPNRPDPNHPGRVVQPFSRFAPVVLRSSLRDPAQVAPPFNRRVSAPVAR